MPLFHIHGLIVNVLASILAGSTVICTPGMAGGVTAQTFIERLARGPLRPTWYSAVPTMHQLILLQGERLVKQGLTLDHTLHTVRNCSAALLPAVSERMEALFKGCAVLPTYAMTESMPICSNPRSGPRKLASVGPAAGPEIKVFRDPPLDATECTPREEGHVCVRRACVTKGYEFKPAHMSQDPNIEAMTSDGWLCTGDKGWLDEDGYLHLSGRFKEIINHGGEKLSPFEVEDVLLRHPAVQDMIAFAMPHELLGEVVGVAVVLRPGHSASLMDLRSHALKSGHLRTAHLPEVVPLRKRNLSARRWRLNCSVTTTPRSSSSGRRYWCRVVAAFCSTSANGAATWIKTACANW